VCSAYETNEGTPQDDTQEVSQGTQFGLTFVGALIIYLILTIGSGDELILWSPEEIIAGLLLSRVAGYFGSRFLFLDARDMRMFSPMRLLNFILYLGPFFLAMAKANIDVAGRVITGKIDPGIVRIRPNMKTDLGLTLLANSITLTPGTLTVDVDEKTRDLFIHWIGVDLSKVRELDCEIEPICGRFPELIRKVTE